MSETPQPRGRPTADDAAAAAPLLVDRYLTTLDRLKQARDARYSGTQSRSALGLLADAPHEAQQVCRRQAVQARRALEALAEDG